MTDRLAIWFTVAANRRAAVLHIQNRETQEKSRLVRGFPPGTYVIDVIERYHRETRIDRAALIAAYGQWWSEKNLSLPIFVTR